MSRGSSKCIFCDGRGRVIRFGEKYSCPYCFPPAGAIKSEVGDRYEKITHYGVNGKVLRVDTLDLKKGESDEVVNDRVRMQSKEAKQKGKGNSISGRTRKRSG